MVETFHRNWKQKQKEKKTNKKQIENRKKYIVAYTELNPLQEEKS